MHQRNEQDHQHHVGKPPVYPIHDNHPAATRTILVPLPRPIGYDEQLPHPRVPSKMAPSRPTNDYAHNTDDFATCQVEAGTRPDLPNRSIAAQQSAVFHEARHSSIGLHLQKSQTHEYPCQVSVSQSLKRRKMPLSSQAFKCASAHTHCVEYRNFKPAFLRFGFKETLPIRGLPLSGDRAARAVLNTAPAVWLNNALLLIPGKGNFQTVLSNDKRPIPVL